MEFVFANDTSGTSNPGCQATVECLLSLADQRKAKLRSRVPVCYGYEEARSALFASSSLPLQTSFPRRIAFAVKRRISPEVTAAEPEVTRESIQGLADTFAEKLSPGWRNIDTLLVNGEGTIHSDSIGAQSLLALCSAAKSMGKRVILTNCSIFRLGDELLQLVKTKVDQISVREPITHRYLSEKGISATQSADCLFLSYGENLDTPPSNQGFNLSKPYVVYSPGVLTCSTRISEAAIFSDITQITRAGFHPVYYTVEQEDEAFAGVAASAGASIFPLRSLNWKEVFPILSGADFTVSGRYHLCIFAALSGTPFVPLESNTPKMAGLLELLEEKKATVRAWESTSDILTPFDFDTAVQVAPRILEKCKRLAERNLHGKPERINTAVNL